MKGKYGNLVRCWVIFGGGRGTEKLTIDFPVTESARAQTSHTEIESHFGLSDHQTLLIQYFVL